ncbi:MAG: hypothetical protein HQL36_04380 [Alphaproteobacteria bacterium]|nr:hypothetical protein [Alphaproteobacteria bacterium]
MPAKTNVSRIAVVAVLAGSALLSSMADVQAANICATTRDRAALEVRVLQSELMVAALTCRQKADYNAFVTRYKPQLKSFGRDLRAFYDQAFGQHSGERQMNKLVTRLANGASQRSLSVAPVDYCAETAQRFQTLLGKPNTERLLQIASTAPAAQSHGVPTCREVANK